jgi:hypothetical protein
MLGLSGIIFMPAQPPDHPVPEFSHPEDIDRTFELLEETGTLLIESAYILLPERLLKATLRDQAPRSGHVFRVRQDLFVHAFDFKRCRLSRDDFRTQMQRYEGELYQAGSQPHRAVAPLRLSTEESAAFHQWSVRQLANARDQVETWRAAGETLPQLGLRARRF